MLPGIVQRIGKKLQSAKWILGLAESCTGGMISAWITDVPGASRFFRGSVVCYANEVKTALLGVSQLTLDAQGAVSEAAAREMASGARRVLSADASLAVTGIAGPDGGTREKPVGTIWLAVATRNGTATKHLQLEGDRASIRQAASRAALEFLEEVLSQEIFPSN